MNISKYSLKSPPEKVMKNAGFEEIPPIHQTHYSVNTPTSARTISSEVSRNRLISIFRNPYLLFSPFLLLFILIVLRFNNNVFENDEQRYIQFSKNLLNGFYSPPAPDINLWNGPGYPLILMPFVAFKINPVYITLLNAVFYYLSIVFLFKALIQLTNFKSALAFCLFWGSYYTAYIQLPLVYTESLVYMLMSLLVFYVTKAFQENQRKYLFLSGATVGFIVLTKIIFGYVVLGMVISFICLILINRNCINYKKSLVILSIGFLTFSPYLFYTYRITHKPFYFGNSGGVLLYWMSTPFESEVGDWKDLNLETAYKPGSTIPFHADSLLKLHHQKFHVLILQKKGIARDEAFKEAAIHNIKSHPRKFIKNWVANIGRLLYDFPNSYVYQNSTQLFKLPMNTITVLLSIFCMVPTFANWKKTAFSIKFLLFFTLVYLAPTTLLSAYSRFFNVIVPILLTWNAYVIYRCIAIKINFRNS